MIPEYTKNFVAPYPPDIPKTAPTAAPVTVLPPAERLLTRGDIMASHRALLGLYETQQQEIADGWGGHRWESGSQAPLGSPRTGMYLATNILLTATSTGGIALITWLLGAGPAWAIAGWIACTGIVALFLTHRQHAAELAHSPIGLARMVAEQTYDLLAAGQDAHYAMLEEERADARAARAAQDAARAAAAAAWMPPSPQAAQCPVPQSNLTRMQHQNSHGCAESEQCSDDGDDDGDDADDIPAWLRRPPVRRPAYDSQAPTAPAAAPAAPAAPAAAAPAVARPPWAAALLGWAASAHDGLGPDGLIIRATPWAARSPWPSADKRAMLGILQATPAIVVGAADGSGGGRYRLDIVAYPDVEALLAVLGHRLSTV